MPTDPSPFAVGSCLYTYTRPSWGLFDPFSQGTYTMTPLSSGVVPLAP